MASLSARYDAAFSSLKTATDLDRSFHWRESVDHYQRALKEFSSIIQMECDYDKRNLIHSKIQLYKSDVSVLESCVELVRQGDMALEKALSLDERGDRSTNTVKLYTQAVDYHMEALRKRDNETLRKRVASILDRATVIKAMTAVEISTSCDSSADNLETKSALASPSAPPNIAAHVTPATSESFSDEEKYILRASSTINGKWFLPWMDDEKREVFSGSRLYEDPDGLPSLSESQIRHVAEYRRLADIVGPNGSPVMIRRVSPLWITQDLVADCSFVCSLCIASAYEARHNRKLITSIIYPQNEHGVPIISSTGKYIVKLFLNGVFRKVVIDDRLPVCKRNRRLLCSASRDPEEFWVSLIEKAYMKVNGGYDFPGSNSGIDLHALTGWIPEHVFFEEDSKSARNSEYPSSDFRQSEDRAWQRILSAHQFGDCLITISTGNLSPEEEEATGLVPGHAYAVLDVKVSGNLRMMQVKNPWARQAWRGRYSSADHWSPDLSKALGVSVENFQKLNDHGIFWIEFSDCRKVFDSFFLNWNPALFLFRSTLHGHWPLSQGPRKDTYYVGASPQYHLCLNGSHTAPQSGIPSADSSTVWVLLSRHITSTVEECSSDPDKEIFLTLHVYRGGKRIYAPTTPYVKGVYSSDPHILTRIDITTEDSTEKTLEYPHGKPIEYTLVLSQNDKKKDINFTLSVYSTRLPFTCTPCPPLPQNQLTIHGEWTESNAGGNTSSEFFYLNPQYRLRINGKKGLDMHIHAMFPKEISASISVIDPRINSPRKSNETEESQSCGRIDCIVSDASEVMTSGNYKSGFCYCAMDILAPGEYIVVISTFSNTSRGPFVLTFATKAGASQVPSFNKKYFSVSEIAPEGYKMQNISHSGEWRQDDGTAAGCSNYGQYKNNPIYLVTLPVSATLSCRLTVISTRSEASNVGLHLALFDAAQCLQRSDVPSSELQRKSDTETTPDDTEVDSDTPKQFVLNSTCSSKTALASSNDGKYVVRPTGASLQSIELVAGQYAIVPSTFKPTACQFKLNFYVSHPAASMESFNIKRLR